MPIFTAGYGNRGFDCFVALMKRHGVTHVVDVRSVPQSSYWEDFRRERFQRILPDAGLKYVYMGDTLGGVENSPVLCKDPDSVELAPFFDDPKLALGLDKLIQAAESRTVCLMCGCLRPHRCHRFRLVGEALARRGIEVLHLDDKGEPVTQEQVAEQAKPLQTSLF
ncbi:DUF488 domain-containing protein [bacterium]|nr:MAG: DUF488 domain-containing protein [bacterium]